VNFRVSCKSMENLGVATTKGTDAYGGPGDPITENRRKVLKKGMGKPHADIRKIDRKANQSNCHQERSERTSLKGDRRPKLNN